MDLDAEDIQEIVDDFVVEATELLDQLDQDLIEIEKDADEKVLNRIFRSFHTIKGTANFLNAQPVFAEMTQLAHAAEDIIGALKAGLQITPEIMDVLLQSLDMIKTLFAQVGKEEKVISTADLASTLRSFLSQDKAPAKTFYKDSILKTIQSLGITEDDLEEIISDVLVEAGESLEKLDQKLILLESDLENQDLINEIFRLLHSLKGNANFLNADPNFKKMGLVSHASEDLMGAVRSKKISISSEILDTLFSSLDMIKKILQAVKDQKQADCEIEPLIESLHSFLNFPEEEILDKSFDEEKKEAAEKTMENLGLDQEDLDEIISDILIDTKESLEKLDQAFLQLETDSQNKDLVNLVFRVLHSLKGNANFLNADVNFKKIAIVAHAAEDLLGAVRKDQLTLRAEILDSLFLALDIIKKILADIESKKKTQVDPVQLIETLRNFIKDSEKKEQENQIVVNVSKVQATPVLKKSPKSPLEEEVSKTSFHNLKTRRLPVKPEQTIRVETNRLDKLMNLVGELVLGRNRLVQVMRGLLEKLAEDRASQDLTGAVDFLNFVISDLQMAVLKTRMQPIGKIFNRFSRTVRDLGRELGKQVKLTIKGAETELDKSVIDELGDPLIHLLRNAVDHGIEAPDVRLQKGKSELGHVLLSASHRGDHIVIELSDDGKGMNVEAIKNKAVKQGLIQEAEADRLLPHQIFEFIFLPGFSTASAVTNVSGRGVGMDVVKNSIEKLNGSIEVHSEAGKGSIFTVQLPLTLAIIQALHVKVSKETFAIPLNSVVETLRVYPHQTETVSGREVVRFRNSLIPLVYLDNLFDVEVESKDPAAKMYVVVVGISEKKIGIVVDKIISQEEIVVKPLGKFLQNSSGISGASISGDGRVTLIIDVAGLFRLLTTTPFVLCSSQEAKTSMKKYLAAEESRETTSILVVEDSKSERKRTRLIMEAKGFKIIEASNGKEALQKLEESQIDLVITDIEMPELDGYQLTARIRKHRRYYNIPVIAVSSHKEMINRIKGMEAGINTYLPKPLRENDIFTAIENLL